MTIFGMIPPKWHPLEKKGKSPSLLAIHRHTLLHNLKTHLTIALHTTLTIITSPCCPNCGSTSIEAHASSGESICTKCGTVIEENGIVSSVQFQEGAGGSASMVGKFVSSTKSTAYTDGKRGKYYFFDVIDRQCFMLSLLWFVGLIYEHLNECMNV